MTKAELIEKIARSRDLPPEVTKKCVQQILEVAFEELGHYFVRARVTRNQNPRFTFPGFGTFTKKKRSARRGVNPRTLEPMEIKASFTLDFKPGSELRGLLNGATRAPTRRRRKRSAATPSAPQQQVLPSTEVETPKPAPRRRRLRSRAEAELDSVGANYDASLFAGVTLPEGPLQRAEASSAGESPAAKQAVLQSS